MAYKYLLEMKARRILREKIQRFLRGWRQRAETVYIDKELRWSRSTSRGSSSSSSSCCCCCCPSNSSSNNNSHSNSGSSSKSNCNGCIIIN